MRAPIPHLRGVLLGTLFDIQVVFKFEMFGSNLNAMTT